MQGKNKQKSWEKNGPLASQALSLSIDLQGEERLRGSGVLTHHVNGLAEKAREMWENA